MSNLQQGNSMKNCQICGMNDWANHYVGPIRYGKFESKQFRNGVIKRCGTCSAARLENEIVDYESSHYRDLVDGTSQVADYRKLHDASQLEHLRLLGTEGLYGSKVVDIGCGAGRFLDLIKGFTSAPTLGIEPAMQYREHLQTNGHEVFGSTAEASSWHGMANIATCFSTIEHVEDPLILMRNAWDILQPGGKMVVTTPNRNDILLDLIPEDYGSFFYRYVHQWYFDLNSLEELCQRAGFLVSKVSTFHRFDISNLLVWLRDRRPGGMNRINISPILDAAYRAALVQNGQADYLVAYITKPG